MTVWRIVLPALLMAVLPTANMIATASSASGGPPPMHLTQFSGPPAMVWVQAAWADTK